MVKKSSTDEASRRLKNTLEVSTSISVISANLFVSQAANALSTGTMVEASSPLYNFADGSIGDWFGGLLYSAGQQANEAVLDQLSALNFTRVAPEAFTAWTTRASFTAWTCLHKALPTAELLWRRGILDSSLCARCRNIEQSSLHLLRDCNLAKRVWTVLLPTSMCPTFFNPSDVVRWLSSNLLKRKNSAIFPHHWNYIFRQTIHVIWLNHLDVVFGTHELLGGPYAIAERSLRTTFNME